MSKLTLYDSDTAVSPKLPMSPFGWKVRVVLNAKRLKYDTFWVETPSIQTILPRHKIPPTEKKADGSPYYTIPAIIDATNDPSNPVIIAGSDAIIKYLEEQYPSLPVFPPSTGPALQLLVAAYLDKVIWPLLSPLIIGPFLKATAADPRIHAHYIKKIGKPIEQIEPGPVGSKEREDAWKKLEGEFDILAEMIERNRYSLGKALPADAAIYWTGGTLSYADYMILAKLAVLKNASPVEGWEKVSQWSEGKWAKFWNSCEAMGLLEVK